MNADFDKTGFIFCELFKFWVRPENCIKRKKDASEIFNSNCSDRLKMLYIGERKCLLLCNQIKTF